MPSETSSPVPDGSPAPSSSMDESLAIQAGIADSIAGRTIPVEALRTMFGLNP
jgi:hypothetical protein